MLSEEKNQAKTAEQSKMGNPNFSKGMPALNPKGRPKGAMNNTSKKIREMLTDFLIDHAYPTLFEKFERLSDRLQIEFVSQVTKYAAPTLSATKLEAEVNTNSNQPMIVEIVYKKKDADTQHEEAEIINEE